jgi:predicted RNase H-like HicB family nuclease
VPPTAVLISSAEGSFVVYDPETGTATQGDSVPEAISNLREATELYLEEFLLEQTSQALLTNLEVAAHA